jgi:CRP-like cAMP-binding protein
MPIQTLEPILIGCASNAKFAVGDHICREGEEADHFYILREGKVAIEIPAGHRHGIIIETIGAGDVLGWSWVVAPYRWRFDARVTEPTRAIALDAKCLRVKCEQDHELGFELLNRVLQVVEQRLQSTRMQHSTCGAGLGARVRPPAGDRPVRLASREATGSFVSLAAGGAAS